MPDIILRHCEACNGGQKLIGTGYRSQVDNTLLDEVEYHSLPELDQHTYKLEFEVRICGTCKGTCHIVEENYDFLKGKEGRRMWGPKM